jgi:hypothetical protein
MAGQAGAYLCAGRNAKLLASVISHARKFKYLRFFLKLRSWIPASKSMPALDSAWATFSS